MLSRYACCHTIWPNDVGQRPLNMPALLARDQGGAGLSSEPSFAIIGKRLTKKNIKTTMVGATSGDIHAPT